MTALDFYLLSLCQQPQSLKNLQSRITAGDKLSTKTVNDKKLLDRILNSFVLRMQPFTEENGECIERLNKQHQAPKDSDDDLCGVNDFNPEQQYSFAFNMLFFL